MIPLVYFHLFMDHLSNSFLNLYSVPTNLPTVMIIPLCVLVITTMDPLPHLYLLHFVMDRMLLAVHHISLISLFILLYSPTSLIYHLFHTIYITSSRKTLLFLLLLPLLLLSHIFIIIQSCLFYYRYFFIFYFLFFKLTICQFFFVGSWSPHAVDRVAKATGNTYVFRLRSGYFFFIFYV